MSEIPPDGPYYDDLTPGHLFDSPPAVTVEGGLAAAYQAITGDGLPLTLDRRLCEAVTGHPGRLANPGLVMHLSIGASTVATKRVIANLFYRNVRLRRPVFEGETLHTTTQVTAMADAAAKPDRPPRGKLLLGIQTTADGDRVLDYERCPLLPLRGEVLPGHDDEIGNAVADLDLGAYLPFVPRHWNLELLGPPSDWGVGSTRSDPLRDVVDNAVALVRLTHNLAAAHRDSSASPYDQRLVYGGHTVALAQASLGRVLPGLATVLGWHACNHVAPVFEGDVLSFDHTLVGFATSDPGRLMAVRTTVRAHRDGEDVEVLDWSPVVYTT